MDRITLRIESSEKWIAGAVTFVAALIAVTPYCGFLFQCGCDWPWNGLDSACNYFKPDSPHRCPWCASMISGILSSGLAVIGGVWSSFAMPVFASRPGYAFIIRVVIGLTVFVLFALSTAVMAALVQDYPLGIGHYLR